MVNKNTFAGILIFTLLLQVFPARASSWNPALLVNTETFQTIDDSDTASDLYVRFGDSLNKRLTFERTLDRFNFNDDVYISGNITASGTASGKIIHAQDTLSSSGTLVWEGAASGASLYVGSFFGASLTDCDADGQTLAWDATTKQFSCGDDDTGGASTITAGQGLTSPATSTLALSSSFSGTSLEIVGTASGRILHAQDELRSSGTILATGNIKTRADLTINSDNGATDAVLTFGSDGTNETLTFANTADRFEFTDDLYTSGTLEVDGNAQFDGGTLTIGDASSDAVTVNSNAWTFANDTNFVLSGGANGMSFDTSTLSIDANGNKVGIGTTAPDTELEVVGTASGKTIFANDTLSSSGNLIVESLVKRGSGAIAVTAAEYQSGAYLYASGASVLALESYTNHKDGSQPLAPSILFGYKGVFDTDLFRSSGSTLRTDDQFLITTTDAFNRPMFQLDTNETTSTQNIVEMYSDVTSTQNLIFRFRADGNAYADGSWNGGGADLAEWFPTADAGMKPGDLACLDPKRPLHVKRCNSAKQRIIGVVSTKPGFVGGREEDLLLAGKIPVLVALIGQVPTKVRGPVDIGDLIGFSSLDGVGSALIATGQSICTALEPHAGDDTGTIICLLQSAQFWTGSIGSE